MAIIDILGDPTVFLGEDPLVFLGDGTNITTKNRHLLVGKSTINDWLVVN
jgi:hypothetical protein